jgi:hypothetical protein
MASSAPDRLPLDSALFCFLPGSQDRQCGAHCMAFKTVGPNNERLDPAQQHCVLLQSIEKAGNGLNVVAAVAGAWFKRAGTDAADARRQSATKDTWTPGGR